MATAAKHIKKTDNIIIVLVSSPCPAGVKAKKCIILYS